LNYTGPPVVQINAGNLPGIDVLDVEAANCDMSGLIINNLGSNSIAIFVGASAACTVIHGNYLGTDAGGNSAAGAGRFGVELYGQNCTIGGTVAGTGNVISGFTEAGIIADSDVNLLIEGNFIGTTAAGTLLSGQSNQYGIETSPAPSGADNLLVADNVISGNSIGAYSIGGMAGKYIGNFIGTNAAGTSAVPNQIGLENAYTVGGTDPGGRNIISGNSDKGVSGANLVEGNYIGIDIKGCAALPNHVGVSDANTLGGSAAGAGNVISGNNDVGVESDFPTLIQGNLIGTDPTGEAKLPGSNQQYGIWNPQGATITGNTISAGGTGIAFPAGCLITGNKIGTNKEGTGALGNSTGIRLQYNSVNNTIGGTTAAAANVISASSNAGILITGASPAVALNDFIEGNDVGTDINGALAPSLGNVIGIADAGGVSGVTIGGTASGSGNIIAGSVTASGNPYPGNGNGTGIYVVPSYDGGGFPVGPTILRNQIVGNAGAGIILQPDSSNPYQSAPVLTTFAGNTSIVLGSLTSAPSSRFRIEFFANLNLGASRYVQGERFLGAIDVPTDSNGNASFQATSQILCPWSAAERLSATATLETTNPSTSYLMTSGFSQEEPCVVLNASANPAVSGQAETFTAVFPPTALGTAGWVTFTDSIMGTLGTATLSSGLASITSSSLGAGTHVVSASFQLDASHVYNLGTVTVTVATPPATGGTPTTYTVNLTSDTGATGDLYWAISQANATTNPAGTVIEFDPTVFATHQTITLSSTLMLGEAAGPEVIQGPGQNLLTIAGSWVVGVLQVQSGVTATISGLYVSSGWAPNGGCLENGGTLTATNCKFDSGAASNDGGNIDNRGSLTLRGCSITNGTSGGLYNDGVGDGAGIRSVGSLVIVDSGIIGNVSAGFAGGVDVRAGSMTLVNSTVAWNDDTAQDGDGSGGGIYNQGTVWAVNATIALNFVPDFPTTSGAGLYDATGAAATLQNTIVGDNYASALPTDVGGVPLLSASASDLIGSSASGGLTNGINGNIVGVDPRLDSSGSMGNGGSTGTIAVLPNSPAIDAGSNALAIDPTTGLPLTYDQRGPGFLRVLGSCVDIGAYEAAAPVTTSNLQTALTSVTQGGNGGSVTVQATSNGDVSNGVAAVNGLASPSAPETVTLDLGGGTYTTDTQVNTQPGVTLVIQNGTLNGGSPALVVNSGNVILRNITAQNATNAPTIVVNGGSLTIRNSTIQESTRYTQVALLVSGGSVDLGTSSSPGGNTFNVNGAGTLIQNTTGNVIPAVGDTFENNGVAAPSIVVLNPTAKGALTLAGNATIAVPGVVIVDSSSIVALAISGNAMVSSPLATGVAVPDPLAGLSGPSTTGLTNYGSISLSKGSQTICPGIYSQIKVSGNASLTLNPGTYIIEGGGLTVTGNASITGSGVIIYNAGSNYPNPGGSFGGIMFSGNGSFNLTASTAGTYAGILIFQSRQNTRALSFSGNAMAGMTGTIYAANALLSMTGNAQLTSSLVVNSLNLSGNVALTQTAAGSDGTGDTAGIANTLMAGDLNVYINDPSGLFTSDELARIQDAVNTWDALLTSYNVTISIVTDPTQANMVIDTSTTSACGGAANGVLGCFNEPSAEITMIQGWNWYAGADPTQIGSGQYDFETTVLHELGHALGLGGGNDPTSPMYEILAAGTTARVVTVADLNIPDPPAGADPQSAARLKTAPPTCAQAQPNLNQNIALMALDMAILDLSGTGFDRTVRKKT
jgi:hypothetical protein